MGNLFETAWNETSKALEKGPPCYYATFMIPNIMYDNKYLKFTIRFASNIERRMAYAVKLGWLSQSNLWVSYDKCSMDVSVLKKKGGEKNEK